MPASRVPLLWIDAYYKDFLVKWLNDLILELLSMVLPLHGESYGGKSLQGVVIVFCFRHMQFIVLDPI